MDRKYPGLIIRGNSVQITFKYKNNRVRETIRTGHKPTKTMMAEIAKKRSAILYEIDMGTFDYAAHFPNSANIYKFSKRKGSMITVSKALNDWIKRAEEHCQYSTIRGYNSIITYHLEENFGQLRLDQVTLDDIYAWIKTLEISNKRKNNILSPLRQMLKDAYLDGLIENNPMDRFRALPTDHREPNPFNQKEVAKILDKLAGQERNLIQFAFSSGLRTSELIALRWKDVDFEKNCIHVNAAIVRRFSS